MTLIAGCGKFETASPPKAARPVSVVTLSSSLPPTSKRVTGSVGSWKTENIGFEVAGRVLWVLEPGAEIEGRVLDTQGKLVTPGTALARVDGERYLLALEAAKAQVEVASLQKAAIDVSLTAGIPADVEAAQAELELAQVEHDRSKRLVAQNATARADLDRAAAQLRTSKAKLAMLDAETKQTEAQLKAAVASIKEAQQNLKEAERNLADTMLYSSFRGQVAAIDVVPGSVVAQGAPVLTVQMMDPIKIEVEVSAEQSRKIQRRHHLPVYVTMPDGSTVKQDGFVYMVDPSADASTRTFTLTLLLLNRKIEQEIPDENKNGNVARTPDLWRMDFEFLPDAPQGTYYIETKAIRRDEQGRFVWKCVNAKVGGRIPKLLQVSKLRITPGDRSIPFLGNWTFQTITVNQGEVFDPSSDFFVGELVVDSGMPDDWNGDRVMLDSGGDWMLRPGDLVNVDLNDNSETAIGNYVPMEAIYEASGETYIFAVKETEDSTVAQRIPVKVVRENELGAVRRITSLSPNELVDGMQLVVGGVHFLQDGEAIRVVERDEGVSD